MLLLGILKLFIFCDDEHDLKMSAPVFGAIFTCMFRFKKRLKYNHNEFLQNILWWCT